MEKSASESHLKHTVTHCHTLSHTPMTCSTRTSTLRHSQIPTDSLLPSCLPCRPKRAHLDIRRPAAQLKATIWSSSAQTYNKATGQTQRGGRVTMMACKAFGEGPVPSITVISNPGTHQSGGRWGTGLMGEGTGIKAHTESRTSQEEPGRPTRQKSFRDGRGRPLLPS